jgi:hypothetical protein
LLLHWLGLDNGSGRPYLFWSGLGSDLAEFAIIGALWHHLHCHEAGCWRLARHQMGGRCRRHRKAA